MLSKKKKKKVTNRPRSMKSNNLLVHDPCFARVGKDIIRHFFAYGNATHMSKYNNGVNMIVRRVNGTGRVARVVRGR